MDGEQGWCVVDKKNTSNTSNEKNTKRYHVQSNAEQTTLAEKKKGHYLNIEMQQECVYFQYQKWTVYRSTKMGYFLSQTQKIHLKWHKHPSAKTWKVEGDMVCAIFN
jgi:hypothetical protein